MYTRFTKMLVGIMLTCFVAGACAAPRVPESVNMEWAAYKELNAKKYSNFVEEIFRVKVYFTNKLKIMAHNIRGRRSLGSYKLKMNRFGDMLPHEYKSMAAGKLTRRARTRALYYEPVGRPLPASLDLRRENLVNVPKFQGYDCGSCWTFSTTAAIEGAHAKKTGQLLDLSQQYMLDCVTQNFGCRGGYEDYAFDYVKQTGGINLAKDYPYTETVGKCREDPTKYAANVTGFELIQPLNETSLMDALYNVGPVVVGIDSNSTQFAFYSSGVFAPPPEKCDASKVDHSFLAIGYGTQNGQDYWLIKNSWGTEWGENGFIKVLRDGNNFCGIASTPIFPTV